MEKPKEKYIPIASHEETMPWLQMPEWRLAGSMIFIGHWVIALSKIKENSMKMLSVLLLFTCLTFASIAHAGRFLDNKDGTVTDQRTGLIWLKNANCKNSMTWEEARQWADELSHGKCGLTDSSTAGQWRVPRLQELQSLVDRGEENPALPHGHPFYDVQTSFYGYWTSDTDFNAGPPYIINNPYQKLALGVSGNSIHQAWTICMKNGGENYTMKGNTSNVYVLPVRGGKW